MYLFLKNIFNVLCILSSVLITYLICLFPSQHVTWLLVIGFYVFMPTLSLHYASEKARVLMVSIYSINLIGFIYFFMCFWSINSLDVFDLNFSFIKSTHCVVNHLVSDETHEKLQQYELSCKLFNGMMCSSIGGITAIEHLPSDSRKALALTCAGIVTLVAGKEFLLESSRQRRHDLTNFELSKQTWIKNKISLQDQGVLLFNKSYESLNVSQLDRNVISQLHVIKNPLESFSLDTRLLYKKGEIQSQPFKEQEYFSLDLPICDSLNTSHSLSQDLINTVQEFIPTNVCAQFENSFVIDSESGFLEGAMHTSYNGIDIGLAEQGLNLLSNLS